MDNKNHAGEYLKMPYARVLTPDDETGTYTAEILEFPGCIAQGDTPEEAYENLESAAAGWIEAALGMGQEIPEPSDPYSYSGRIALRLPRSLHRRAAQMAERDGTSLNQFLVAAIAESVGARNLYGRMIEGLERRWDRAVVNTMIRTFDEPDVHAVWPGAGMMFTPGTVVAVQTHPAGTPRSQGSVALAAAND